MSRPVRLQVAVVGFCSRDQMDHMKNLLNLYLKLENKETYICRPVNSFSNIKFSEIHSTLASTVTAKDWKQTPMPT